MKRATEPDAPKVHRNFKLHPAIDARLEREAKRTGRTKTALLELALQSFLNMNKTAPYPKGTR